MAGLLRQEPLSAVRVSSRGDEERIAPGEVRRGELEPEAAPNPTIPALRRGAESLRDPNPFPRLPSRVLYSVTFKRLESTITITVFFRRRVPQNAEWSSVLSVTSA